MSFLWDKLLDWLLPVPALDHRPEGIGRSGEQRSLSVMLKLVCLSVKGVSCCGVLGRDYMTVVLLSAIKVILGRHECNLTSPS